MQPRSTKLAEPAHLTDVPLGTWLPRLDGARVSGAGSQVSTTSRGLALHWSLLALVPFVLLATLPRIPGPGLGADDFGQYLMHAQALATGHAYGDINYIHSTLNRWIGPAATLPGLPLLLAPVLRLAGVWAVPWVMLFIALWFPFLAGRYFARREPPILGLGAAVICVLSPGIVFSSTQALTDIPFAGVLWGMALIADREGDTTWLDALALTVLGGAALLLRTAAVAIVPALLVTALLRRRSGGLKLALPVLAWGLLAVVVLTLVGAQKLLLVHVNPMDWVHWAIRSGYMKHNAVAYAQGMLEFQLGAAPHGTAWLVLRVLALGLTVAGVVEWMRRNPRAFVAVFAVVYGLMLIGMPLANDRYLWPLLPLTAFGLLNAVRWGVERLSRRRVAVAAAAGLALVVALLGATRTAYARRPVSFADEPQGRELLDFLRTLSAHEQVRLTFMKPRMLAWTLGVPVMGTFVAAPEVALRELCARRITHVIVDERTRVTRGTLRSVVESRPTFFQPVYSNQTFRVYRYSAVCQLPERQEAKR